MYLLFLNHPSDPEISPHSYSHKFFNSIAINKLEKRESLQQTVLGKLDVHMEKTGT
jgi:hypothetical protein